MKKFTSIHDVSFGDLLEVLQEWEDDVLHFDKVQAWAETIFLSEWHEYEKDDSRSILVMVIQMLEDMYWEPILKKDISILRQILTEAQTSTDRSWNQLNVFRETTNWEHRKRQVHNNIDKGTGAQIDSISDP
jgi:hypothetical protein